MSNFSYFPCFSLNSILIYIFVYFIVSYWVRNYLLTRRSFLWFNINFNLGIIFVINLLTSYCIFYWFLIDNKFLLQSYQYIIFIVELVLSYCLQLFIFLIFNNSYVRKIEEFWLNHNVTSIIPHEKATHSGMWYFSIIIFVDLTLVRISLILLLNFTV